jgi:putative ubiquitin-RnfH superfamily antitoxin RatB of RatAB toxin-antitoxin module
MKRAKVAVEVVSALPERQIVRRIELPAGSTVEDAASASGLAWEEARLGIYGKAVPPGTILKDGDRVEIYRPLLADPKDLRRLRAKKRATR